MKYGIVENVCTTFLIFLDLNSFNRMANPAGNGKVQIIKPLRTNVFRTTRKTWSLL